MTVPPIELNLTTCVDVSRGGLEGSTRAALLAQTLVRGTGGFKSFKSWTCTIHMQADDLLERLALSNIGLSHRVDAETVMLHDPGFFLTVDATGRGERCACRILLWAESPERAEVLRSAIFAEIGDRLVNEPLRFLLDWRFLGSNGEINGAITEERVREELLDEAYPHLADGCAAFIERYLNAPESVLLLQGPPGTGKTRLIRGILGAMSLRKGVPARAVYAGEKEVLAKDELYLNFLTGEQDVFLVEDADLLLSARAEGNQVMQRFLNIADGIMQAQNRKIIFSTNLHNVRSIDEALIRPGRCFAHVFVRELTLSEGRRLLERLCLGDEARVERAVQELGASAKVSLAKVYAALRASEQPEAGATASLGTVHSMVGLEPMPSRKAG